MEFKELFDHFPKAGKVVFIGVRPERRAPLNDLDAVFAFQDIGLEGDRHKNAGGKRQVTLIQAEHLTTVASILGVNSVEPTLVRRNIVVSGINLLALKGKSFEIGEAIFEYSGECHPCSRMEENLGIGGYNAMRGHGGITAKVIRSGKIQLNDSVFPIS
jgi:MOSC domain-containing protein YiiM